MGHTSGCACDSVLMLTEERRPMGDVDGNHPTGWVPALSKSGGGGVEKGKT